jgi:hypothetical protein
VREDDEGSRPVPDPTLLTTEALLREISHLEKLINLRFELIERQRLESKEDNQKALDAALLTAKDSVAALAAAAELERSVILGSLGELKDRIIAVESTALGASQSRASEIDQRGDSQGRWALIVAIGVFALMVVNEFVVHIGH